MSNLSRDSYESERRLFRHYLWYTCFLARRMWKCCSTRYINFPTLTPTPTHSHLHSLALSISPFISFTFQCGSGEVSIQCPESGEYVRVDSICPDIAMTDLSNYFINYSALGLKLSLSLFISFLFSVHSRFSFESNPNVMILLTLSFV